MDFNLKEEMIAPHTSTFILGYEHCVNHCKNYMNCLNIIKNEPNCIVKCIRFGALKNKIKEIDNR